MDLSKIMEMANQVREQMQSAQAQAGSVREEGESGGGMVKVVMNGHHEVIQVKIDPMAARGDDLGLLEDLIRAAVNQASARVADKMKQQAGQMAADMGVDLSTLGFPPKE